MTQNLPSLLGEPSLSPFIAARSPEAKDSSSDTASPPEAPEPEEPSPEEAQPDDPILEAQLQYGLDIQEREPENPLTPNEPAYLHLIEEAVAAGLNVPPPPPLTPQREPSPAPQPIVLMAAQAPAAPAAPAQQTGKLRGETPDIFTGTRKKSETFIRQFNLHLGLNDNHEIMRTPYLRTMYALSLIKGPLVNDWVNDQVTELREKVTRANNPIGRDEEALWNAFEANFTRAFTDTAKAQNAHTALEQLTMRGDDIDTYIATFRHLVKDAGYDLTDQAVHHMFGRGLGRSLLYKVLMRETQPTTMAEWEEAACAEKRKEARMNAMIHPQKQRYQWIAPRTHRNGSHQHQPRCHPNDMTVPMDVDTPVFTQVNRAYTEEDKIRHKQEGRCFRCSKRGHMARDCPDRKEQPFKPTQRFEKKKPFTPRSKPQGFRKFNKPRTGFQGQARVASIEEIDSDDEDLDVPSLVARTARLSDDQKEDWLKELDTYGVHF